MDAVPELYMDDTMGVTPELYMDDMAEFDYYMETGSMDSIPMGDIDGAAMAMGAGIFVVWFIFMFALMALMIASLWKIFTKAGEDGWKAIIPIYNTIVLLGIAGKPWWWLLLMFIPFVNIVVAIMMWLALFKSFGKPWWWILFFLVPVVNIIIVPVLAFGSAEYIGPDGQKKDDGNTPPQTPHQPEETIQAENQNPIV